MEPISRVLAKFIYETSFEDIPPDVVDHCKDLILDTIGAMVAGSRMPWTQKMIDFVRQQGAKPESTILVYGDKSTALYTALANGSMARAFELDDIDERVTGGAHPGCAVIPAALALAERENLTGKDLITAIVVGYDVSLRIGRATDLFMRGFSTVPTLGTFGAAAAAGKCLKLDRDTAVNTLCFAATNCSGLAEYLSCPSKGDNTVRMEGGQGAYAGVLSALLAKSGLKATDTLIDGERGFCHAFSNSYDETKIHHGLGKDFELVGVGMKRYSCCSVMTAPLDALSIILQQNQIDTRDIKEVSVTIPHDTWPSLACASPADLTTAQFSMPFSVALKVIAGGNFLADYAESNLKRKEILDFAKKVRIETLRSQTTRVVVKLSDGGEFSREIGYKGLPVTKHELQSLYRRMTLGILPEMQIVGSMNDVADLEQLQHAADLCKNLCTTEG